MGHGEVFTFGNGETIRHSSSYNWNGEHGAVANYDVDSYTLFVLESTEPYSKICEVLSPVVANILEK